MQKTFKSMILDKGGWFPMNCEVIRDTSPTAAILFFFLINMQDRHADGEGWFYAKNNYLSEQLGFKKDALKNAFDLLHIRGYLGVKAILGFPNEYKILRYESTETAGVAENPHTLTENKNNPAVLAHTPAGKPLPPPCGKTATPLRENLLPPAVLTPPPCGLDAYPPAENPHTNKEYIKEELSNNNKKQKVKEEESADFTNPLSLSDFETKQISILAAKLVKPENVSENIWAYFSALCKSKKKKFTKKGWGGATNKLVEGVAEFGEPAMLEHLENWAESETWTSPFFKGSAWKDAIRKNNPSAIAANDPRNLPENNAKATMQTFIRIKELYSSEKMGFGLVPKGATDASEKEILKGLWAKLLAVTSTQPAEFEKELAIIETALKAERAQRANGKVTMQAKTFENWIKFKGWENFVVESATKAAQKPQKTAPIAPKVPTVEQTPETPTKVQQSANFELMNVTPKYKVLGDAAERANAYQGKVFVWDNSLTDYANGETFRKLTGINNRALLAQKVFNTRTFAEYITKQFGVDYADAEKLSKQLAYIIPAEHEQTYTQAERANFPVVDVSKFLTTRSSKTA